MRHDAKESLLVGLVLCAAVAIILGLAAGYGHLMYGDWKCGMPGVHCRRVVKEGGQR